MAERNGPVEDYRNVHCESDMRHAVRVPQILLSVIGIWPRSSSFQNDVRLYAKSAVISFLMFFLLVPHVIYTFFDCEDLSRYMKVIAAQVFSLMAIIKFWTMIINRRAIRFCLKEMEIHYRHVKCEEDRSLLINCARHGRFFTTLYLSLTYGGAVPYHVVLPLLSERIVREDNTTQIPLPYLSNYVFFVIEDSPFYEITFVSQMFISFVVLSANCGIYSLIAAITMHSCGLFEIVNRRVGTFSKWNKHVLRDWLRDIVQHHLKAMEFVRITQNALSIVFLSEMVGCTLIICFLEFGVIMEWEDHRTLSMLTYFILMTSIFTNVFIISFIGDRVKQESEKVGETTYFLPWYDVPEDIARSMRTIILRCNRPSTFTAASLFKLSLQAFCDVAKTSAAYLNFLRTMAA